MNTFLTSDHHFSHENFLRFLDAQNNLIRGDKFQNIDEMDDYMIQHWNHVVAPSDKVYHLGDVCFNLTAFHRIMPQLNGVKVLILGNHDKFKMHQYTRYFKDIYESRVMDTNPKIICTHRPEHPMGLEFNIKCNVHGHIHEKVVPNDTRYFNVSVERNDYTPFQLDEVLEHFRIYAD